MYKSTLLFLLISALSFSSKGQIYIPEYESEKSLEPAENQNYKPNRFFLKVEVASPIFLYFFIPKTRYIDFQGQVKIHKKFYLTGIAAFGNHEFNNDLESQSGNEREVQILKGTVSSDYYAGIRFFPFYGNSYFESSIFNYLFLESGIRNRFRSETTEVMRYSNTPQTLDYHYLMDYRFWQLDYQFNIGLSAIDDYFDTEINGLSFSPEVYLGISRANKTVTHRELTYYIGNEGFEFKDDKQFYWHIRIKLGIGFGH